MRTGHVFDDDARLAVDHADHLETHGRHRAGLDVNADRREVAFSCAAVDVLDQWFVECDAESGGHLAYDRTPCH